MVEESFEHRAITRQILERKIPEVKTAVLNLFSDVPGETERSPSMKIRSFLLNCSAELGKSCVAGRPRILFSSMD